MIYAAIAFVIGVVIGTCVAQSYTKRYFLQRLKTTKQDLFAQYVGELDFAEKQQAEATER